MQGVRHILWFLLLIGSRFISSGQAKNVFPFKRCSVKTINFEQGLLNNSTSDIITDRLGFTWISTRTGLQRYNGYVLETIVPVAGKDTFNINYPVFLYRLNDGNIWISFKRGVLEYDPVANSFKHVISIPSGGYSSSFPVVPLKETKDGIWCMQQGRGIVIYNRKGIFVMQKPILDHALIDDILSSNYILLRNIITSNDRYIFLRDKPGQIECIDLRNGDVKALHFNRADIFGLTCTQASLYIISDLRLWCVNPEDGSIKKNIELKDIIKENIITGSLYMENNSQLLVNLNSHLYQLDTSCIYQNEFTDLNRNPIVSTGYIVHIYTDNFRRIWLLTNNDIKRIENIEIPFAHFVYPNAKHNFVRSLYYDEQKYVVIAGCLNGGIQLYDTLSNPLWSKPLITADVKDVIGIEKLTDDEYLVITFGRGWFLLNLSTRLLRPFNLTTAMDGNLKSKSVNFGNNIQRLDGSTIALSTSSNVFRCVFSGDKLLLADPILPFKNSVSDTSSFPSAGINSINCFLYASDKTWWAGTLDGLLYRLDKNKNFKIIHIPENYLVRSITEDSSHHIWVGTDKGLCVYAATGDLIKKITRETGLLNDCIYALLPADKQSAVFASSNLGLSYVSAEGSLKNFSKETGLQENEFNSGSCFKTAGGRYYFGGVNGITAFYPAALFHIIDTPVLHITRLVINDSLYNSSAGIRKGDSILLNYHQNHLRIDLVALGLLNANEYLYKYRLLGFENSWQTTYQPTGINYILEPGHYTLELICSPILSSENTFSKKIVIIIYPPWWRTWWFGITAFIIAVAVIAFFIQQYNRRKYMQKIRALQLQHEIQSERERISRDLHDNIGAYASAMSADIETIGDKHSTGEHLVHNLKHNVDEIITSLRETIWALSRESITVTGISDRFKNYINKIMPSYPAMQVQFHEEIHTNKTLKPVHALNIFRILQEAFHNAIKHSNGHFIIIHIYSNDQLTIIVEDDGVGISNRYLQSGHGLHNMQLRAREAGLILEITASGRNNGTKVSITDTTTK